MHLRQVAMPWCQVAMRCAKSECTDADQALPRQLGRPPSPALVQRPLNSTTHLCQAGLWLFPGVLSNLDGPAKSRPFAAQNPLEKPIFYEWRGERLPAFSQVFP